MTKSTTGPRPTDATEKAYNASDAFRQGLGKVIGVASCQTATSPLC